MSSCQVYMQGDLFELYDDVSFLRQHGDGIKWSPGSNTQEGIWTCIKLKIPKIIFLFFFPLLSSYCCWLLCFVMSEDYRLSQNDLRLKLMRKRLPKQGQGEKGLHAKLSNPPVQTPPSHHMPQYKSEASGSTIFRKIPTRESADDLLLVDSLRNSYSSWTTNGLRSRSPDRTLRNSLGLSPPRNIEELWKVSSIRAADASMVGRFPSSCVVTTSRPMGSIPVTKKAPPGTTKLVSQFAPGGGSMQQSSHMVLWTVCSTFVTISYIILISLVFWKHPIAIRPLQTFRLCLVRRKENRNKERKAYKTKPRTFRFVFDKDSLF